jgi:DNA-binding transcriptional MerR regulator
VGALTGSDNSGNVTTPDARNPQDCLAFCGKGVVACAGRMLIPSLSRSGSCCRPALAGGLSFPRHAEEADYRRYDHAQRQRLKFVLHCRTLVMTHDGIHRLPRLREEPERECAEVNALLDEYIDPVTTRIRSLPLKSEFKTIRNQRTNPRAAIDRASGNPLRCAAAAHPPCRAAGSSHRRSRSTATIRQ